MEQNLKQLWLKDLCARVPYHPKGLVVNACTGAKCDEWLTCATFTMFTSVTNNCRLYLRPMSSMTEEEKNELNDYIFSEKGLRHFWFDDGIMYSGPDNQCFIGLGNDTIDRMIDWLNSHHFDYRNLLERGLALEAPKYQKP